MKDETLILGRFRPSRCGRCGSSNVRLAPEPPQRFRRNGFLTVFQDYTCNGCTYKAAWRFIAPLNDRCRVVKLTEAEIRRLFSPVPGHPSGDVEAL